MKYYWGLLIVFCALAAASERRILLRDIQTLLFESGKLGTGFRTEPAPQMTQVGGPAIPVSRIWCKNAGWDGRRVLWECRLPDDVPATLGEFEISCEGFERAGDPYVLAGSCGIEYSLVPSARAEPHPAPRKEPPPQVRTPPAPEPNKSSGSGVAIGLILLLGVLVLACRGCPSASEGASLPPSYPRDAPVAAEIYEKAGPPSDEKPVSTEKADDTHTRARKTKKSEGVPPATDESPSGWSNGAMLSAAAASFVAGRMTAPAPRAATAYDELPSRPTWSSSSVSPTRSVASAPPAHSPPAEPSPSSAIGGSNTDQSSSGWFSSSSAVGDRTPTGRRPVGFRRPAAARHPGFRRRARLARRTPTVQARPRLRPGFRRKVRSAGPKLDK